MEKKSYSENAKLAALTAAREIAQENQVMKTNKTYKERKPHWELVQSVTDLSLSYNAHNATENTLRIKLLKTSTY